MGEKRVVYQKPQAKDRTLLQRILYHKVTIVLLTLSIATLFLCVLILFLVFTVFSFESWKTILYEVCFMITPIILLALFSVNGIVEIIKTTISITTIVLEDGVVKINFTRGRKNHCKTIKATRINAEKTRVGFSSGGPNAIAIFDYGSIVVIQRIRVDEEMREIDEMIKIIKTVRAESGKPLPWL